MNQGRFAYFLLCLLALGAAAARGQSQPTGEAGPGLRLSWAGTDHVSGIYYVKDEGKLTIYAENGTAEGTAGGAGRGGREAFGRDSFWAARGGGGGGGGEFKPLSVTPIEAATLAPGERVKIPIAFSFAAAGGYELRWKHGDEVTPIENGDGGRLQCIFAPRTGPRQEFAWITVLPRPAVKIPGYLTDYAAQTTVRRFLIDERFSYDPAANVGLGFGASTGGTAREVDALLAEVVKAKVQLTLRVSVPLNVSAANVLETMNAFKKYVDDAVRRSKGALVGLVIKPEMAEGAGLSDTQASLLRSFYLAGYEAAKKADKNILMLGPGSRLAGSIFVPLDKKLGHFDGLALADAAEEPLAAAGLGDGIQLPWQILPPAGGDVPGSGASWAPVAGALAAKAVVVPLPGPEVDNGVTAHLFGGAVFSQRIKLAQPAKDGATPETTSVPFIGVFQGDGFSVAAIAGFSAGCDIDGLFPALARTRTEVAAAVKSDIPAGPVLEVSDDTHSMRVVDARGSAVECRVGGGGDQLFVPAGSSVVYILQASAGEELAGSLRAAARRNLPLFEVTGETGDETITLHFRNISATQQAGKVRLIAPAVGADQPVAGIVEKELAALGAGEMGQVVMALKNEDIALFAGPVVVEITTAGAKGIVQRTAITLGHANVGAQH